MALQIDSPQNFPSPPGDRNKFEQILQRMFPDYQRLVVEKEFVGGSFSGSWVFLGHLISDETAKLPVVVKIASLSLIEKEWQAYQKCVKGNWPAIAAVKKPPILVKELALGGLYYTLVGEGIFRVQSLRSYCLEANVEEIEAVLARLAKIIERAGRFSRKKAKFRLQATYDPVLPINLWVKPISLPSDTTPTLVTPDTYPELRPESYVRVSDFIVTKVDLKKYTITLNVPRSTQDDLPLESYTVRLKFEANQEMPSLAIGQKINPVEGIVIRTRLSEWQNEITNVLGELDLESERVLLSDGTSLPNPYLAVKGILERPRDIKVSYIHGDLNLENILVDPDVRDVRLIDFAEARWDHVLHDFLRLETEIVTKLMTPAMVEAGLRAEIMLDFYQKLHCATFHSSPSSPQLPHAALERAFAILKVVRTAARNQGLFNPTEYAEYYDCLTLYLLGALKFRNLNRKPEEPRPWPKELAFFCAAAIQQVQESGDCQERADQYGGFNIYAALVSWSESIFRWSEAEPHMLSSWEGRILHAMSAITDRITPRGLLTFLLTIALWMATAWLITPVLAWPLDELSIRQSALLKHGIATLLIPFLVAFVTRSEKQEEFALTTWWQQASLWLVKSTGALVGFYLFSTSMVLVALIWYYLGRPAFSIEVRALLAFVPLFFSYIMARRIPYDRYKMFEGQFLATQAWRRHSADSFFFGTFLFIGPLTPLFLYYWYWFFEDRVIGSISILLAGISIALWEYKKRDSNAIPDPIAILILGFLIPLLIPLFALYETQDTPLSAEELPALLMILMYFFSWTLLGATLLVRNKLTLTFTSLLARTVVIFGSLLTLSLHLWLGRVLAITILLGWILWGRKSFKQYLFAHESFWLLEFAIGGSLVLWAQTNIPPILNALLFFLIFILLMRWAYHLPSIEESETDLFESLR